MAKDTPSTQLKRRTEGRNPRPSNQHIKDAFPDTLAECLGIVTAACKKAGINHDTYYDWRRADEEWAAKCDVAYDKAGDFVESKLYELVRDKNPAATIFYCKTKLRHRGYVERRELEGSVTIKHEDRLKELK